MRSYPTEVRRSRTPADLFFRSVAILSQDAGEYGFVAAMGGIAAALGSLVFLMTDFDASQALVAPVIFAMALLVYAMAAAGLRRVHDNLEPDAMRSLGAVLVRLPFVLTPALMPLAAAWAGVFLALTLAPHIGAGLASTLAMTLIGLAAVPAFQRALYVPALFVRDASFASAQSRASAAMRATGPMVGVGFALALVPAGFFALIGLGSGFGPLSTAAVAFVFVASMPLVAGIASLAYEEAAPPITGGSPEPRARAGRRAFGGDAPLRGKRHDSAEDVAARISRHLR